MSETKHTPGPWVWTGKPGRSHLCAPKHKDYQGVLGYADYEGMWPCTHSDEEDAANMRLIAAAPRMFSVIARQAAAGDAESVAILEDIIAKAEGK